MLQEMYLSEEVDTQTAVWGNMDRQNLIKLAKVQQIFLWLNVDVFPV